MPSGIYPRKPKETTMAKKAVSVQTVEVNGVKVEDPAPAPLLKQMQRMWMEASSRTSRLRKMYELAEEARQHLSEKEFKKVEQSVFNDFQVEVADLSTGVAKAAANDQELSEDEF